MKIARALSLPTSPGLRVLSVFLVVAILALELGASASTRVGIRMTPAAWLALVATALVFSGLGRAQLPTPSAGSNQAKTGPQNDDAIETAFNAWKSSAEVLDARTAFPEFLDLAQKARLAIFPSGTTFLAARFSSPGAAQAAAEGYREFFGMTDQGRLLQSSWSGARSQTHDFASVRCQGELLLACTTRERANLDPRLVLSVASASSTVHF